MTESTLPAQESVLGTVLYGLGALEMFAGVVGCLALWPSSLDVALQIATRNSALYVLAAGIVGGLLTIAFGAVLKCLYDIRWYLARRV